MWDLKTKSSTLRLWDRNETTGDFTGFAERNDYSGHEGHSGVHEPLEVEAA
jgi:hypothetical protein